MEITWYSAAALVMREGAAAIAFDPFFGMPVGCFADKNLVPIPRDDFSDVTDVFVTHGHVDHIYYLPELSGASDFRMHCTPAPRKTLLSRGVDRERIAAARAGVTDIAPPFAVTAYKSRHCEYDFPIIMKTIFRRGFFRHPIHLIRFTWEMHRFPENGEILMYEVLCEGKRIQVLGSLGLDESVDYPVGADVLILPFQGRSDLDKYALGIVRRLMPQRVLLDHCDDAFPPISDEINTENFIRTLSEQEHIPCDALAKGKKYYV